MTLDIKFYLSIFWRRFHYFAVVAALIGAIGVSIASVLPSEYSATATLLVENPDIPPDMLNTPTQIRPAQQVTLITQRLTTRASLIDQATELGIYRDRAGMDPDLIVEDMRRRLRISNVGRDNRVTVSFRSGDARQAAEVANHFAAIIEREALELRRGVAGNTLEFFQEETNRLNQELGIRRARVLDYRMQNRDRLPESLEFRRNRMTTLQTQIAQSLRDEAALEQRRTDLVALYEATGRVSNDPTPIEQELARAQQEMENALRLYSAQNPRVRVVQARVQELEQAAAQERAAMSDDVQVQFQQRLDEIEAEIAAQTEFRTAAEAEMTAVQQSIDETTVTAIRLQEMERELGYIQSQHNSIASQLARAQMGERIELLSRGQRISILELATVPRSPSSPNRPLLAGAGVGGGLVLGIALVVLLEVLNRSIRRPVEITRRMGITPIATIPMIRSRGQILFRRTIILGALAAVLVGVPLTLWALHTFYLPLDLLIDRVLQRTGIAGLLANTQ
jgi:uncharacterized protein involved in exopolysaccharide biosynthesis